MEELLTIDEAAKRLGGLSPYTVQAWLSQGRIRRTKVGRLTRIRASELEKVIEDGGKSQPVPRRRKSLSVPAMASRAKISEAAELI